MESRRDVSQSVATRRCEERFPAERVIVLMPLIGHAEQAGRRVILLDCSAHGIGVLDTLPMKPDDQFAVYVQVPTAPELNQSATRRKDLAMIVYSVRHCTKLDDGKYKVGAELWGFINTPDEDPDRVLASLLRFDGRGQLNP
jgi:hypothetical protein